MAPSHAPSKLLQTKSLHATQREGRLKYHGCVSSKYGGNSNLFIHYNFTIIELTTVSL